MKKVHVVQEFPHSLEVLLRAREERYKHLDKFPELKNVHTVSEERSGHILKQERHISIAESMPAAISAMMPSGSMTLIEKSEFDTNQNLHSFHVVPGGTMNSLFEVSGVSKYYALDAERTAREYDIEVKSSAFLIGGIVENAIADLYARNLDKDYASIEGFIKMLGEQGFSQPPS
ncbi:MAG: DUF2505 family protein [Spirochaetia bacterium]|nr:DUF2505 family protein [Spirochaetia bacterium]